MCLMSPQAPLLQAFAAGLTGSQTSAAQALSHTVCGGNSSVLASAELTEPGSTDGGLRRRVTRKLEDADDRTARRRARNRDAARRTRQKKMRLPQVQLCRLQQPYVSLRQSQFSLGCWSC